MQEGGREALWCRSCNDLGKVTEPDSLQHHTATLKVLHLSQMSA